MLLIEAGPRARRKLETRIPAAFSKALPDRARLGRLDGASARLDGREVVFPRGRMLGGSAVMNAMMVLRGHPADYDAWAAAGCPGWSWADAEPAFARSADGAFPLADLRDRHVLTEAFVHAAQAAGIPFATTSTAATTRDRLRARLAAAWAALQRRRGYLRPARRRPNLTVVTGALVDPRPGRARARGRRRLSRSTETSAEEEALAARGSCSAPGRSGRRTCSSSPGSARATRSSGPASTSYTSSGVGRTCVDHLANGLLARTQGAETLASAESLRNLARWALRGRGPLTSNLGEAAAFVRTRPGLAAPDLELLFAPVLFEDEGLKQPTEHGLTLAVVLLQPRSAGTVLLRSADPLDAPAIDPRYLTDPGGEDERRSSTASGSPVACSRTSRSRHSSR